MKLYKAARKWKRIRRLTKMEPKGVAFVHFGANQRPFAVIKEESPMSLQLPPLEKVEQAAGLIAKIVTVIKAGSPDAAATEALQGDLDSALTLLSPEEGRLPVGTPIGDVLKSVLKELSYISQDAQTSDMAMADKIDAVAESVKSVSDAVEAAQVAPVAPIAPVASVASETAPVAPAAAVIAPVPAVAPVVAAASNAAPVASVAPVAASTVAPAAVAPVIELVPAPAAVPGLTKADLAEFGKALTDSFKVLVEETRVLKQAAAVVVAQPALAAPVPGTSYVPTHVKTVKSAASDTDDDMDLAESADLKKMSNTFPYGLMK